jgi:hypothetical protein
VWGEVTPAERLRAVTRRTVAEARLAAEAADALAGFAVEPASLVVACRRVLAHHPAHGALWWVCARILAAADAAAAARDAVRLLEADRTADRLGATLPLIDAPDVVAVVGWPAAADEAFAERVDVPVVALRVEGNDPTFALRHRRADRGVRVLDPWDPTLTDVVRLLVPAHAIGPGEALVPAGTASALAALGSRAKEIWLLGGVGRVLPGRLFDVVVRAVEARDDERDADRNDEPGGLVERVELDRFDRVAGPRGLERPADAAARVDCPVVPELLRPLG